MVNTNWGGVVENNHFGTHEFMDLCELLGCEPFICGNVGSGTVREMAEWIEYLTSPGESPQARRRAANGREEPWRVRFWGVGNENWGCGGRMRPEYYADLYRRYRCFCNDYGENRLMCIACGATDVNYHWTRVLMKRATPFMNGLSLHHYTFQRQGSEGKGPATGFGEEDYFRSVADAAMTGSMLDRHAEIMDRYDPEKRIAMVVDEWGVWTDVEPGTHPKFLFQQNTVRDALVAATILNAFNRRCDRVRIANLAQTVNVLQSPVLTEPGGGRLLKTPTWHVFEMYAAHHEATLLETQLEAEGFSAGGNTGEIPAVDVSASRDADGRMHVTLANLHNERDLDLRIELEGLEASSASGRVLCGESVDAHNTFEEPGRVAARELDVSAPQKGSLTLRLPAASVTAIELR
jgi:alpha-N-arabinofuranosidase